MGRPNRGMGTSGMKRSGARSKGRGRDKYRYGGSVGYYDDEDYDDTDY